MSCRICKQATLPGARLCGPCRSALKRARHGGEADVTVLDDESSERFGAAAADRAVQDSPLPHAGHVGRRRWPAIVMIASILGAAAYVLPRSHFVPAETHTVPAADASRVHASGAVAVTGLLAKPSAAQTDAARVGTVPGLGLGERALAESEPPRNDDRRRAAGDPVRHARKRAIDPITRPESPDSSAVTASSSRLTPTPTTPVVIAEVAHTRWQSMADAMAACQGGFLDRLLCRQKARIAFCDGYWGRVTECATAPATDVTR